MKTKKILIKSAIEVLNQDPSSKLDVIAEKAQVTRRTLHRYFSSREEMIQVCGESIIGEILTDVKNALNENDKPVDQLHQMFVDDVAKGQQFEFCMKYSSQFQSDELKAQFQEMGILFYGVLDNMKTDGLIDSNLSNEWLSYVWMGMIKSTNQALLDGVIAKNDAINLGWSAFIKGVLNTKNK